MPLSRILQKVLADQGPGADKRIAEIRDIWRRSVGSLIDANTRPAALRDKNLIVHVSNSVWMQELQFLKEDIIGKINGGRERNFVEEIKFRIGPV